MNRLLAYLTSIVIVLLVLEGGARLIGMRPTVTINRFDRDLGWVKEPASSTRKQTSEYDIRFAINSQGLRDDEVPYQKPAGEYRILVCGDSFTLGYTVDRDDLFVDLLERALRQSGLPKAQVLNGGTEGYSTDQELAWLRREGLKYHPDLVILAAYQNDIYWNGETAYLDKGKPRFSAAGDAAEPENVPLEETGRTSWLARHSAIAGTASNLLKALRYGSAMSFANASGVWMPREDAVVLRSEPAFITGAYARTRACLRGFHKTLQEAKIPGLVVLIPSREQVQDESRPDYQQKYRLAAPDWDPDLPTTRLAQMCAEVGLDHYQPLAALRSAHEQSRAPLYFAKDWHFNAAGNHVFADALARELGSSYLADRKLTLTLGTTSTPASRGGLPTWLLVVVGIWLVLSLIYALSYRDEHPALAPVKIGLMIGTVVGIIAGMNALAQLIGPSFLKWVLVGAAAIVALVILFRPHQFARFCRSVLNKIAIMREVMGSFVNRGMWYMLPLLVGMLTLGSLLVVAASSPFIAPFIYTLF
ncbi:MAG: DUF5989 family protein [Planctomycetota bacterium]